VRQTHVDSNPPTVREAHAPLSTKPYQEMTPGGQRSLSGLAGACVLSNMHGYVPWAYYRPSDDELFSERTDIRTCLLHVPPVSLADF